MEESFKQIVGSDVHLNSNIRMEQVSAGYSLEIYIYNYSDEDVAFQNHTFDTQGFWPDTENNQWIEFEIPIHSPEERVILKAGLAKLDPITFNELFFFESLISKLEYDEFRLYIHGEGLETGNQYGAYIDICPTDS